jgi:hypothetical protein
MRRPLDSSQDFASDASWVSPASSPRAVPCRSQTSSPFCSAQGVAFLSDAPPFDGGWHETILEQCHGVRLMLDLVMREGQPLAARPTKLDQLRFGEMNAADELGTRAGIAVEPWQAHRHSAVCKPGVRVVELDLHPHPKGWAKLSLERDKCGAGGSDGGEGASHVGTLALIWLVLGSSKSSLPPAPSTRRVVAAPSPASGSPVHR